MRQPAHHFRRVQCLLLLGGIRLFYGKVLAGICVRRQRQVHVNRHAGALLSNCRLETFLSAYYQKNAKPYRFLVAKVLVRVVLVILALHRLLQEQRDLIRLQLEPVDRAGDRVP